MFCSSCGNEIPAKASFCSECGAAVSGQASGGQSSSAASQFRANLIDGKVAPRIYALETISANHLANAKKEYLTLQDEHESVVVLFDDTVFGGARKGFVFTNRRLVSNIDDKWGGQPRVLEMPLSEVRSFRIIAHKMSCDVIVNDEKVGSITQVSPGEVERANSLLAILVDNQISPEDFASIDKSSMQSSPSAQGKNQSGFLSKAAGFVAVAAVGWWMLGSGGSTSVEEICQETSDILIEHQGQGFTQGGMLGCLRLGATEAKRQQEALKEMFGV